MLWLGTKGTNVIRSFVDQAMPDHFILTSEALTSFASPAAFYVTVIRSFLTMYVGMRARIVVSFVIIKHAARAELNLT